MAMKDDYFHICWTLWKGWPIYDKQLYCLLKNSNKSAEMQAGSGLKKKLSTWRFVKFLTYFCAW